MKKRCKEEFGVGWGRIQCDKEKGHKGRCSWKTDEVEIKWGRK